MRLTVGLPSHLTISAYHTRLTNVYDFTNEL